VTIKAREFDQLMDKLGFETRDSGDLLAWFEHDGKKVLWTKRSKLRGDDLPFQHQIRQQMKLNEDQLREALRCRFSRDDYVTLLQEKGLL